MRYYPKEQYQNSLHVGVSSAIVMGSYYGYQALHQLNIRERVQRLLYPIPNDSKFKYLLGACLTSITIGTIKEIVDSTKNRSLNMKDMTYNFIGVQLGVSFLFVVDFDLSSI